jgi:hypothetical protein
MVHRMGVGREISFLLLVFVLVVAPITTVGASTAADVTSSSSSSYTSMRALDKFGNAVPLKHAREAAVRHGRLVVAAATAATQTSPFSSASSPISPPQNPENSEIVVVSVGNRSLVSSLTLPLAFAATTTTNHNHNHHIDPMVAMCCTGVKSDADWLTRQMQAYVSKVWERYDLHPMSTGALAHWLARLLGRYQQPSSSEDDDDDDEWQSSVSRGAASRKRSSRRQEQAFESSLSRPLGVQTILLSTSVSGSSKSASSPSLLLIEPTGRVFRAHTTSSFSFVTMGKQSDKLKEALLRCIPPPTTTTTPQTMEESGWLEDVLTREILNLLAPSTNEIVELLVERLGPSTTKAAALLRYQSGNLLSRTIL